MLFRGRNRAPGAFPFHPPGQRSGEKGHADHGRGPAAAAGAGGAPAETEGPSFFLPGDSVYENNQSGFLEQLRFPCSADRVPDSGSGSSGSSAGKETKGEDGTNIGKGASESLADRTIQAYKSEKDPKGSVFNLLQARLTKNTKTSLTLKWKKVPGAKKYIIYGNACGKKNKLKKQTTKTGTSYKVTKVNKKKLKKGTYYKFIIMAVNSKGKVISTSKIVHACTKGGKVGNDKKVKTNNDIRMIAANDFQFKPVNMSSLLEEEAEQPKKKKKK